MCRPHLDELEGSTTTLDNRQKTLKDSGHSYCWWGNVWWTDGFVQKILNVLCLCCRFCTRVSRLRLGRATTVLSIMTSCGRYDFTGEKGSFFNLRSSKVADRYVWLWCNNNARRERERKDAYREHRNHWKEAVKCDFKKRQGDVKGEKKKEQSLSCRGLSRIDQSIMDYYADLGLWQSEWWAYQHLLDSNSVILSSFFCFLFNLYTGL